jgi:hypothetical protein
MWKAALSSLVLLGFFTPVGAQILVEDPTLSVRPRSAQNTAVGESAARKYFQARKPAEVLPEVTTSSSGAPRFLHIYLGSYLNDKQYRWGSADRGEDVGELIGGVTYRMGEWVNSMDLSFRGEFLTYDVDGQDPKKFSVGPIITFPDANSGFPVYFGAGAGLGVFFDQVDSESDLSFDYQIFAGVRQSDLLGTFGLALEVGLKGHVHLLSSGQFSGVYFTVGTVHEF